MKKHKIIITDDHPVVIKGIRDMLSSHLDFDIIGEFREGRSLSQSPALLDADLLLLDLNMPEKDGLDILGYVQRHQIDIKTLVITSYRSAQLVDKCREYGAHAYITKSENLNELVSQIYRVIAGERIFPDYEHAADQAANKFTYLDQFLSKYKLTKREVEIIKLVCKDHSSHDIAHALSISIFTVQTHRRNIIRKLGLDDSKIALYRFALENGIL